MVKTHSYLAIHVSHYADAAVPFGDVMMSQSSRARFSTAPPTTSNYVNQQQVSEHGSIPSTSYAAYNPDVADIESEPGHQQYFVQHPPESRQLSDATIPNQNIAATASTNQTPAAIQYQQQQPQTSVPIVSGIPQQCEFQVPTTSYNMAFDVPSFYGVPLSLNVNQLRPSSVQTTVLNFERK